MTDTELRERIFAELSGIRVEIATLNSTLTGQIKFCAARFETLEDRTDSLNHCVKGVPGDKDAPGLNTQVDRLEQDGKRRQEQIDKRQAWIVAGLLTVWGAVVGLALKAFSGFIFK